MANTFPQLNMMDSAALQQFSQLMFLQSLLTSGNISSMATMPSHFQQMPTFSMPPKIPPQIPTNPPSLSPSDQSNLDTLAAISKLLSAHQNLKSQLSPSSHSESKHQMSSINSNNNIQSSPYQKQQLQKQPQEYRISVTRESAKPLQEWMNQNIHHPYPTSSDIQSLSKQTGFSLRQIRNWFTNNRRRFELQAINQQQTLPWQKKPVLNQKSPSPNKCEQSPIPQLYASPLFEDLKSSKSPKIESPSSESHTFRTPEL
uniref:Homeobox domain-containing protein n=1 Tax=Panagrolaimus sp. ES5 TaxID=591445 RepID=A0AC34GDE8_9BILA